jgi:thiaminase/transcriptional activator TenA
MIFNKMCGPVKNLLNKIHHLPFNQELTKGTLPKEKFIHYLMQDTLYLSDFAKALAQTASRLSDNDKVHQFMKFSLEAIQAERNYYLNYIEKNALDSPLIQEQSPACFMYTNYLLKTATLAPVEEAVASLLPCFWIYREVGTKMAKEQKNDNPYHEWIALYASDQFDASVKAAIAITNQLGELASLSIQDKMVSAFVRSTQLEWLFWDSAYRQETWSIVD